MATGHEVSGGDSNVWVWLAGLGFALWSGLNSFIIRQQADGLKDANKRIDGVSVEREDHCIPRMECQRTHQSLDKNIDEIKMTLVAINRRLDDLCGQPHKG